MAPIYKNFRLTACRGGWRYRHEELDIGGTCPSLIECVRAIDELCAPPVMRFPVVPLFIGVSVWALAALLWGW